MYPTPLILSNSIVELTVWSESDAHLVVASTVYNTVNHSAALIAERICLHPVRNLPAQMLGYKEPKGTDLFEIALT